MTFLVIKLLVKQPYKNGSNFFQKHEKCMARIFFLTNCITHNLISLSFYVEITTMAWKYLECEHYRIMQLWSWM